MISQVSYAVSILYQCLDKESCIYDLTKFFCIIEQQEVYMVYKKTARICLGKNPILPFFILL